MVIFADLQYCIYTDIVGLKKSKNVLTYYRDGPSRSDDGHAAAVTLFENSSISERPKIEPVYRSLMIDD